MAFLTVVLGLVVLVTLHEAGHFLAARAVGIRATKFYVFFPPALIKRRWRGVEYGIGSIPAGGFVRLPGMFRPVPGEHARTARVRVEPVLAAAPEGDRLAIDAALRRADAAPDTAQGVDELDSALADLEGELARLGPDDLARGELRGVAQPGREVVLERARDHVRTLRDDCAPDAYWRAALWRRMTVIAAGPLVNVVIAAVVLFGAIWLHSPDFSDPVLRSGEVVRGGAAWDAGMRSGDVVTGVNGPIGDADPEAISRRIKGTTGEAVVLTWERDGTSRAGIVVPRPQDGGERRIGVLYAFEQKLQGHSARPAGDAARLAGAQLSSIATGTFTRLPRVLFDAEERREVRSVVGIVGDAKEVDQSGILIAYIAIISMVLAVMNLLPLLPLDGGHLLFGFIEAVRRRSLPRVAFERYSIAGFALVMLLFAIGLRNDIVRLG